MVGRCTRRDVVISSGRPALSPFGQRCYHYYQHRQDQAGKPGVLAGYGRRR
jgi:hypothetical protein